jgi:hypothetical protein
MKRFFRYKKLKRIRSEMSKALKGNRRVMKAYILYMGAEELELTSNAFNCWLSFWTKEGESVFVHEFWESDCLMFGVKRCYLSRIKDL